MKFAILGRTHWLYQTAQTLVSAGHECVFVATAPASPEYMVTEDHFAAFSQQVDAPFLRDGTTDRDALLSGLEQAKPQVAISINWPSILGKDMCSIPEFGILNAHAGDLPRYRGNACPNWAIIAGEPQIGLCIHAMTPGEVDSGPIYVRRHLENTPDLYIEDVYSWLDQSVPDAFSEALSLLEDTTFHPFDQSTSPVRPLRCHPRRPEDAEIDWTADACRIQSLVRASSRPFSGAFSWLEGQERVTIWKARVAELDHDIHAVPGQIMGRAEDGAALIACGVGTLAVEEAELASGKTLSGSNRYRLTRSSVEHS